MIQKEEQNQVLCQVGAWNSKSPRPNEPEPEKTSIACFLCQRGQKRNNETNRETMKIEMGKNEEAQEEEAG